MAKAADLVLLPEGLRQGDNVVPDAAVLGFHEHFDPWRAAVWVEVAGPGWQVPVGPAYRELRRALRARYADRPYTADWSVSGRFPALVLGEPPALATLLATLVVVAVVTLTGLVIGPAAAVASVGGWIWALGRLRAAVVIGGDGITVGPAWAPLVPWHEVERVAVTLTERAVHVRVWTVHGVSTVWLPRAAWPACGARLRRLGGLVAVEMPVTTDERYLGWRALAAGAPWGLLAGSLVAGSVTLVPFVVWAWGGLVAAAAAFVGAAVEARLQGWRTGGVFWMTAAWAVTLVGIGLALWRWTG